MAQVFSCESCEIFTELLWKNGKERENIACKKWDFPHVVGALDGKNVRIECPKHSGSLCYNSKQYFSMIFLAVCDANYGSNFGSYGSNNDCRTLLNSVTGEAFEYNKIDLPDPQKLRGCRYDLLTYFSLGNEIFPLKS